jgi:hypothetical protein
MDMRFGTWNVRSLCRIGSLKTVAITGYYYADQIKENEVGRACGTHGRGEKRVQGLGGKARRKETTWKTKV